MCGSQFRTRIRIDAISCEYVSDHRPFAQAPMTFGSLHAALVMKRV